MRKIALSLYFQFFTGSFENSCKRKFMVNKIRQKLPNARLYLYENVDVANKIPGNSIFVVLCGCTNQLSRGFSTSVSIFRERSTIFDKRFFRIYGNLKLPDPSISRLMNSSGLCSKSSASDSEKKRNTQ